MDTRTVRKTINKIDKEYIKGLSFTTREVLMDTDSQLMRNHDLHRAQILGNLSQGNVCIWFEAASHKTYMVETTIWAVDPEFVTLKGGTVIPIKAIIKVD